MTFEEILHAAYDEQGYQSFRSTPPSEPGPDVVARFKRYVNEGLDDLLGRPRLGPLRHGAIAFSSIVGQPTYAIADAFDVIDAIIQPTNDRRLRAMTRDWYRTLDPGERSEGSSYVWIEEGYAPVIVQPHGTPLWAASTSPADITQKAHVFGAASDGYFYGEQEVTLNGLTRVQVGYPSTWEIVTTFFLDAVCAGNVNLWTDPVAGRLIATIVPPRTSVQYHQIRLWPTPSAAEPYLVDGQLKVVPLTSPNDVPMQVPRLYHQALVDYVNYMAYAKNGDFDRAATAKAAYERRLSDLTNKVEFSPDYRPVRGALGPDARRWTNLPGGWYPADGWGR